MITKEELKELLKGRFEECSIHDANYLDENSDLILKKGYLQLGNTADSINDFYFKPVEQFPIVFNGDNYNFKIEPSDEYFILNLELKDRRFTFLTEKDIKANQDALDKLKELRQ